MHRHVHSFDGLSTIRSRLKTCLFSSAFNNWQCHRLVYDFHCCVRLTDWLTEWGMDRRMDGWTGGRTDCLSRVYHTESEELDLSVHVAALCWQWQTNTLCFSCVHCTELSVDGTDDVWFINFYSPRCSHCHELAPAVSVSLTILCQVGRCTYSVTHSLT